LQLATSKQKNQTIISEWFDQDFTRLLVRRKKADVTLMNCWGGKVVMPLTEFSEV